MLEKIKTFVRTIRINKECDEYIGEHFPNKTEFMRKSIEFMAETSIKRIYEPMGFVGFNKINVHGSVRYYWGYYLGRQFVLVVNALGADFLKFPVEYKELINKALCIQPGEEVDYYYQYKVNTYTCEATNDKRIIWSDEHYGQWDFNNQCLKTGVISSENLVEMRRLMDMHDSHFILNRKAYVYERLYGATTEWDENAPFAERCKNIKYKGAIE